MSYHPTGEMVEILGIEADSTGRSCELHRCCGKSVVKEDTLLRLCKIQNLNLAGKEETAIAAVWVTDGIDRCRVGFLARHLVKHWRKYDGVLAQVTDIYDLCSESAMEKRKARRNCGCAIAALVSAPPRAAATGAVVNKDAVVNEDAADEKTKEAGEEEEGDGSGFPPTPTDNKRYSPKRPSFLVRGRSPNKKGKSTATTQHKFN